MCIDRPDHIVNGKRGAEPDDLVGCKVLAIVGSWAEAFDHVADDDMETSWGDGTDDEKAAAAECHIRDWANYYSHKWIDGRLVIFGEP